MALAIPPGYASPLFPSAGIALALVLLRGPRLLPAIALGSFATNLVPLLRSTGHLQATGIAVAAVMIAFAIVNRYVLLPALEKGSGGRAIVALSLGEIALGAGAVGLVSYFGLLDPA